MAEPQDYSNAETAGLLNSLYINLILFSLFMAFFEVNRHMKSTYLKRATKKFKKSQRVPPTPSNYPFAWIISVMEVGEDDLLRMVGLDGYMLIRYINVCFRMSAFFSFWGVFVLVPLYSRSGNKQTCWNKYTLANIDPAANELWIPAIFAYMFSMYFCHLMYTEYKNFVKKRVDYLIKGDPDTPPQTYYTLLVEKVPITLRSAPALEAFYEKLFPGDVYSVEVALDLNELDILTTHRRSVRDKLEKSTAVWKATGKRPYKWIHKDYYKESDEPLPPVAENWMASFSNHIIVDAISHLSQLLTVLNDSVRVLQIETFNQRQKVEEQESQRQQNIHGKIEAVATQLAEKYFLRNGLFLSRENESTNDLEKHAEPLTGTSNTSRETIEMNHFENDYDNNENLDNSTFYHESKCSPLLSADRLGPMRAADPIPFMGSMSPLHIEKSGNNLSKFGEVATHDKSFRSNIKGVGGSMNCLTEVIPISARSRATSMDGLPYPNKELQKKGLKEYKRNQKKKLGGSFFHAAKVIGGGVEELAKEGYKTVFLATKGALRGVLEGVRALDLLTVGAYYKTSSTAFITLKSRVATNSAHQLFLSHVHYSMVVRPAPNPKDCVWENISVPQKQISMRRTIADGFFIIGAVFWSIVVGFIAAISNLESLTKDFPWLNTYKNTIIYEVLNDYLAVALLLILLSVLPIIFDVVARSYEGLKLESEIQNSIMTRYFYYQLANVFVSVGLGSIASSLHQIIESPSSVLSILGSSLPSLSVYFTNLLIVKTFTAVPLELLRVWPLIQILSVRLCIDKTKCTIRELKTGALANPPILYGWIYPNLLMVLMIISTYSCISPLLCPFGMIFYAFVYLMYKYQLLYVYTNEYQSGGYMWYAVFNRSMVALIAGQFTLLGYLGLRETFFTGPFYLLAPLPFCITYFWYNCDERFKKASIGLSLESAIDIDAKVAEQNAAGFDAPINTFQPALFRQPSLAEGRLKPQSYRTVYSFSSPNRVLKAAFRNVHHYKDQGPSNPLNVTVDNSPERDGYGSPHRDFSGGVQRYLGQEDSADPTPIKDWNPFRKHGKGYRGEADSSMQDSASRKNRLPSNENLFRIEPNDYDDYPNYNGYDLEENGITARNAWRERREGRRERREEKEERNIDMDTGGGIWQDVDSLKYREDDDSWEGGWSDRDWGDGGDTSVDSDDSEEEMDLDVINILDPPTVVSSGNTDKSMSLDNRRRSDRFQAGKRPASSRTLSLGSKRSSPRPSSTPVKNYYNRVPEELKSEEFSSSVPLFPNVRGASDPLIPSSSNLTPSKHNITSHLVSNDNTKSGSVIKKNRWFPFSGYGSTADTENTDF